MRASVLKKIDAHFVTDPIVSGPNVFTSHEYAEATGVSVPTAQRRLKTLLNLGEIRPVRVRRKSGVYAAFEFIGKESRVR